MKVKNIFKDFFYLEDDEDESVASTQEQRPTNAKSQKPQSQKKSMVVEQEQFNARQPMATPMKQRNPMPRKKQQAPVVVENEYSATNVVSFSQKSSKLVLFEPFSFSEAQDIGDCLKNKRAAVVNLQRIEKHQGKRLIDFLSGAIFALNGDIKQIGTDIFLCTPDNVEIDGDISNQYFE